MKNRFKRILVGVLFLSTLIIHIPMSIIVWGFTGYDYISPCVNYIFKGNE